MGCIHILNKIYISQSSCRYPQRKAWYERSICQIYLIHKRTNLIVNMLLWSLYVSILFVVIYICMINQHVFYSATSTGNTCRQNWSPNYFLNADSRLVLNTMRVVFLNISIQINTNQTYQKEQMSLVVSSHGWFVFVIW